MQNDFCNNIREKRPDKSKMNALAIERRGGRDGGAPSMSARPIQRLQPWNKGLLVGQKETA